MNQSSTLGIAVAMIAVSVLALIGIIALRSRPAPAVAVPPVSAEDYVRGSADAPVTLIEYFDFECPACRSYAPVVKALEAEFGGQVAFVARPFPLPQHRNGIAAAIAAAAAGNQDAYWEMHDLLFERYDQWTGANDASPAVFEGYAQELGLDVERFRADVAAPETRARVERSRDEGLRIGVNSTPTFFLNGTELRNPGSIEAFRELIRGELAAASVNPAANSAAQ